MHQIYLNTVFLYELLNDLKCFIHVLSIAFVTMALVVDSKVKAPEFWCCIEKKMSLDISVF